ncbi:DUF1772 domain-containing protein [Jiangella gansuensis]|uniref:anthrone oxygenase family protein n=1 Tax=Jiangella gansuensis TaxID=281473 RepID=UPI00047E3EDF|nr:anthrone oxygenase family protein [Jiangella gansuensis]
MSALRTAVLLAATVTMGLAAGLFQAFSYAVMPGLGDTRDEVFVEAMQRINVAIVNPWFATIVVGALVLTGLAAASELRRRSGPGLAWTAAALLLYVATLVITRGVSIPLNDTLDAAGDPGALPDVAAVRERFEDRWNRWNAIRALTSTAAFGCLAWALARHRRWSPAAKT